MERKNSTLCVRNIEFDAGHRLVNHDGKCAKLHGHRYKAEFHFESKSNKLNNIGMVIDFSLIYKQIGDWINDNLDHNVILNILDKNIGNKIESEFGQKIYYLDVNPTAENIASHLLCDICPKVINEKDIFCSKIRLWETPNCYVEVVRNIY